MIVTGAVVGALLVGFFPARRRAFVLGLGSAGVMAAPLITALGFLVGLAGLWIRRHRARLATQTLVDADVPLLAELTALGLSAGMPFSTALLTASEHVADDLGAKARTALRARALRGPGSDVTAAAPVDELLRVVGRAELSGAPLLPAVNGYVDRLRAEERAQRLAAVRRLPVKLLFPLALLILPGFLLLTVAPAVLSGIRRLGI